MASSLIERAPEKMLDIAVLVRRREKQCRKVGRYPKVRHGSVAEAMNVVTELRLTGFIPKHMKVGVFYCGACCGWHWGRPNGVKWEVPTPVDARRE